MLSTVFPVEGAMTWFGRLLVWFIRQDRREEAGRLSSESVDQDERKEGKDNARYVSPRDPHDCIRTCYR